MATTTPDTSDTRSKFSADREFKRLMVVALMIIVIAAVGAIFSTLSDPVLRSLGIIAVTMITGGMGGAAIGFLFGIPRVLTDANSGVAGGNGDTSRSATMSTGRRFLASNSNLEQVSDWLTKVILGVGLTQFYQLDDMLYRFEGTVRMHVAAKDVATPLIATIAIVFSVICGFLAMYLETRLVLSRIFNSVERDLFELQLEKANRRADQLESAVQSIADTPANSAKMLAPAAEALRAAANSDQASPGLKSIAAQALAASGRTNEATNLIPSGDDASVQDRISAMQVALYKKPYGFNEVIAIGAELSRSSEAQTNADYWFYQCAAFGQQHHFQLTEPESDARTQTLKSAHDHALDCMKRCLAIDSSYSIRFFWLMNPALSSARDDNDLADFANDAAFRAIVPDPGSGT